MIVSFLSIELERRLQENIQLQLQYLLNALAYDR